MEKRSYSRGMGLEIYISFLINLVPFILLFEEYKLEASWFIGR